VVFVVSSDIWRRRRQRKRRLAEVDKPKPEPPVLAESGVQS
jgi:hypothetical protein